MHKLFFFSLLLLLGFGCKRSSDDTSGLQKRANFYGDTTESNLNRNYATIASPKPAVSGYGVDSFYPEHPLVVNRGVKNHADIFPK